MFGGRVKGKNDGTHRISGFRDSGHPYGQGPTVKSSRKGQLESPELAAASTPCRSPKPFGQRSPFRGYPWDVGYPCRLLKELSIHLAGDLNLSTVNLSAYLSCYQSILICLSIYLLAHRVLRKTNATVQSAPDSESRDKISNQNEFEQFCQHGE